MLNLQALQFGCRSAQPPRVGEPRGSCLGLVASTQRPGGHLQGAAETALGAWMEKGTGQEHDRIAKQTDSPGQAGGGANEEEAAGVSLQRCCVFPSFTGDETYQDIFRDFSQMASNNPEKLKRFQPPDTPEP